MTLSFSSSPRSTLGIEWELQLIDRLSNDLRQDADSIMARVRSLGAAYDGITKEMLRNTIELVSRPHQTVNGCMDDIHAMLAALTPIVDDFNIDLAGAGSHPFAHPDDQLITATDRYEALVERTRYWGRQMLLFGVHIHVGIDDVHKVFPIQRGLSSILGHFLAISSSSPFWDGIDTGYASNRTMIFQQLPTAGLPRHFTTWEAFSTFVHEMTLAQAISSVDELRWDIRPSPKFGTIELRVFDAAPTPFEVETFAALTQCFVEYFSRMLDRGFTPPAFPDWFIAENKWRAARFGLDAELIIDQHAHREVARAGLLRFVDLLMPVAEDLGCVRELTQVVTIVEKGAAYERLRRAVIPLPNTADGTPPRTSEYSSGWLTPAVELLRTEMKQGHP